MKKFLPHLIALAAFIVITMLYFSPLLGGKELKQGDINNWKGMAKEIMDYKEKTGEQTLWTNSMFGGMPAYQISAVYKANLMQYVDKVITLGLPTPANFVFIFMAGFYFLLLTLKLDQRVAILGAMAFGFSSYFLIFIDAGHNSKAHAIGYMAPVVAGIIMTYRGRYMLGAAITAIALALELYANHLQITYYLMMIILVYIAFQLVGAFREKKFGPFVKASAFLGVAAVLAVLTNITNLWATQEYGKYSTRGPSELTANKENQTTGLDRDYITDWSFGVGESITLFIPDFKGGATEPITANNKDALNDIDPTFRQYVGSFGAYFGDQPFTSGPAYVGSIVVLLFLIGAFVVRGPLKWWLVISTALSLMLSWGRNFMSFTNLFLDYLPGYDKFRAVTTIIVIAQFTMPLLGILAVNQMITEKDFFVKNKKKLMYALGIGLGLTLLISLSPGTFTQFYTEQEHQQVAESIKGQQNAEAILDQFFDAVSAARKHIVRSDATRSFIFMLIAAAIIFGFLKYKFRKEYLIFGLLALIIMDLIGVDRRYLGNDDFVNKSSNAVPFPESQADAYIKRDTTSYRVLNLAANIFNDASTSYYHQSIGGYHGAKLKRYKELIDYSLTQEVTVMKTALQRQDSSVRDILSSQPVINMLNTKYIIYNPESMPHVNAGAMGNAWFVTNIKWVANADAEIAAMNNTDFRNTVLIDERFKDKLSGFNPSPDPAASIALTSYKPNHLTYKTSSSSDQLAVLSEIYYDKGWNAFIDGKPADFVRADYVLRAMKIPAGQHVIEYKFEPAVVATGEKISLACSALLLIFAAFAAWKEFGKKDGNAPEPNHR